MITETLQHRFALSEQGARDMMRGCLACALHNFALMMPVGLVYYFVGSLAPLSSPEGDTIALLSDSNTIEAPSGAVWGAIVLCLLAIAATYWLQYNQTYYSTYVESGVRRIAIAERLRRLPLSFFGRRDLADLTSTIMADCATMETASSHWIEEFFGAIVSTAVVALSLFFFDWRMACASLWPLPVSLLIVILSPRVLKAFDRRQMAAKMQLADGIQECIETLRELKSGNAESRYLAGLDRKIDLVEHRATTSEFMGAAFVMPAQMVLKFGIATTAIVGGSLIVHDELSIMHFFLFLLVVSRLYDPMAGAMVNLAAIISTQVPANRLNEILEHPMQTGSETLTNRGYDIRFENVSFAYNEELRMNNEEFATATAAGDSSLFTLHSSFRLKDVSFTARQGEVTALIGPSGGGKTTVSRLAARFWDVTGGRITIGGMDVSAIDPERLLSLFSIVFQDVTLFNNTVMENIRIGRRDATDEEVIRAARLANCDEFVSRLPQGYHTDIGENGSRLSGGERQRISIARAFLKDAPIILLDEATASLDVENESLIQRSLARLIAHKTVLVIAHRMRTIAHANHIVVLRDGVVAQQGSPEQLLREGGYYRAFFCKKKPADARFSIFDV